MCAALTTLLLATCAGAAAAAAAEARRRPAACDKAVSVYAMQKTGSTFVGRVAAHDHVRHHTRVPTPVPHGLHATPPAC
jgi:hypothetical protein